LYYYLLVIRKLFGDCPDRRGRFSFDIAALDLPPPNGKVCGATLTNPYEKISKIKLAKTLDAALQHFYITSSQSSLFHGRRCFWGSKTK